MFLLSDEFLEVRETSYKGRGVFARKEIPAGSIIGDYLGKIIRAEDDDEPSHNFHTLWYSDDYCILPDESQLGVHLVNHSCTPNCDSYLLGGHTMFFTLRRIFPGEELTISYLLDPPDTEVVPCKHTCHCGSRLCHGTMHASADTIRRWNAYVMKKQGEYATSPPVAVGQSLPALDSYPDTIPDDPIYDLFANDQLPPQSYDDPVMPAESVLRQRLRETGKCLAFPKLNVTVYAVMEGMIILTPQSE